MATRQQTLPNFIDLNVDFSEERDGNENDNPNTTVDLNITPSIEEDDHGGSSRNNRNSRNLTNQERRAIYEMLLQKSEDGYLGGKVTGTVASHFSISVRTVRRIWKQGKSSNGNVNHQRTRNCGRKRINVDFTKIRDIPLKERTTIRGLASSLNTNSTSLHRFLRSGNIQRRTNALKPSLREENKMSRLKFCIEMLEESTSLVDPTFIRMHNVIHIDEKWFYMRKNKQNYYMLPEEEDPLRTCQSKNFIPKVMFLAAVARPRFSENGNVTFDGKIGIFPLVTQQPARRNSINRPAGTLETKAITSVTRDVIRSFMIEKVLPAIKEKWPIEDRELPIFIQQDNARTHIDESDASFCQVALQDGWDIRLMCQPPNSPDLNVLDLGYFRAIQSLFHKEKSHNIDELVGAVLKSFDDYSIVNSNRIFLTLQLCMIEIMKVKGSNNYKIPHINKEKLEREGRLPVQIKCDRDLVLETLSFVSQS